MGEVIPEEPEIGLEIRHLIHGNYRIFYLCARGRVTVIRIIHAARRITAEMLGLGQSE